MNVFKSGRCALSVCVAAVSLAACGTLRQGQDDAQPPIAPPGSVRQSAQTSITQGKIPSYLYVADPRLHAVVAFDGNGNEVAEKTFRGLAPVDVVTDSRGNVYVDLWHEKTGTYKLFEFTHALDRRIAEYHPPGYSGTIAVDANDNLYVEDTFTGSGFVAIQDVARYPYGSTKIAKVYTLMKYVIPTNMLGISVRGNTLFGMVNTYKFGADLFECSLSSSGTCVQKKKGNPGGADCGFTTTQRMFVTGEYNTLIYYPMHKPFYKHAHVVDLPSGYQLQQNTCRFHSYRNLVWGAVVAPRLSSGEAFEVDLRTKKVITTIGATVLNSPVAAYFGNGFTP